MKLTILVTHDRAHYHHNEEKDGREEDRTGRGGVKNVHNFHKDRDFCRPSAGQRLELVQGDGKKPEAFFSPLRLLIELENRKTGF